MSIREELPPGHMAEIIQFPVVPAEEVDVFAEINEKIEVAFNVLHGLIAERVELEKRLAA